MTSRTGLALLAGALALMPAAPCQAQAPLREIAIAYVDRDGDPAYRGSTGYAGLFRRVAASPFPAAELAVADSAAAARVAGLRVRLVRRTLGEGETAAAAVTALGREEGALAALLDLPLDEMRATALALAAAPMALFNARHRDDELRHATCRTRLFHTQPTRSMLYDGLAQGLVALGWPRVLVLRGPLDEDGAIAAAFAASAKKFGLRIAETRPMLRGNDPRNRDQINTRLLTANVDYDVVFLADSAGDIGRSVAFGQMRPRPVAGTHGLVPSAWHAYWERHGAPQLNRRFHRATGRPMADADWATWVAVRAVIDALIAHRDTAPGDLGKALLDPASRLELYKALPGSFRPWSRQLRQAILLGTHDVVQTLAPVEGVLHEKNQLDTLGPDEPEFVCAG